MNVLLQDVVWGSCGPKAEPFCVWLLMGHTWSSVTPLQLGGDGLFARWLSWGLGDSSWAAASSSTAPCLGPAAEG